MAKVKVYDGTQWVELAKKSDLSGFLTNAIVSASVSGNTLTLTPASGSAVTFTPTMSGNYLPLSGGTITGDNAIYFGDSYYYIKRTDEGGSNYTLELGAPSLHITSSWEAEVAFDFVSGNNTYSIAIIGDSDDNAFWIDSDKAIMFRDAVYYGNSKIASNEIATHGWVNTQLGNYLPLSGNSTKNGYINIEYSSTPGDMPALSINYDNNNGGNLGDNGLNMIKFGTIDNYIGQIPANKSHLGVATFGLHTNDSHGFEFITSGWTWVATLSASGVFNARAGLQVNGTNVALTSDLSGYVQASSLGTAAYVNTGTGNGNIPVLDANGKLSSSVLPAIAITDTFVCASQAAMLALTAEIGDVCVRTDLNKSFILQTDGASTLSHWQELLTPTDAVLSVNGQSGAVSLSASDVGALPLSGGTTPVSFNSTNLPQFSGAPQYLVGIEAFADGGTLKWQSASSVSVGYANSAGNADTVDNEHASAFAHIGADNNLIAHGNELNFVPAYYSPDTVWFNYRTASGNFDATGITTYTLGDGKGGALGNIIHTGNIGSQSVAYATSAGSVAWSNVDGRPTAVSSFTNDSGYITASSLVGYATQSWVQQQGYLSSIETFRGDIVTGSGNYKKFGRVFVINHSNPSTAGYSGNETFLNSSFASNNETITITVSQLQVLGSESVICVHKDEIKDLDELPQIAGPDTFDFLYTSQYSASQGAIRIGDIFKVVGGTYPDRVVTQIGTTGNNIQYTLQAIVSKRLYRHTVIFRLNTGIDYLFEYYSSSSSSTTTSSLATMLANRLVNSVSNGSDVAVLFRGSVGSSEDFIYASNGILNDYGTSGYIVSSITSETIVAV